jgi:hypothetical protein
MCNKDRKVSMLARWLLLLLTFSFPVLALTPAGIQAPIQGVGALPGDCQAAMSTASGNLNGGTNGKAVALVLPTWAASADVDFAGTFTGNWAIYGSVDGLIFRPTASCYNRASRHSSQPIYHAGYWWIYNRWYAGYWICH